MRNQFGGLNSLIIIKLCVASFYEASSEDTCEMDSCPSLEKAKELGRHQPDKQLKKGGEYEGLDYWEDNQLLFAQAWSQLPRLYPELYEYNDHFQNMFINSKLRTAVQSAKSGASNGHPVDESEIWKLMTQSSSVEDVFYIGQENDRYFGLFTREFCDLLLEELEHLGNSGIPMRRPNGMNRYGAILDQIGFESTMKGVVQDYIRPLAEMLFPQHISGEDAAHSYSFVVDYQRNTEDSFNQSDYDIDLKEHRDSSIATLNMCLGYDNFTGGNVTFREDNAGGLGQNSKGTGDIVMRPGLALIHKGQHRHAALPIEGGRRVNLIIWLMGEGGYVRVMPYSKQQQLTANQRWTHNV